MTISFRAAGTVVVATGSPLSITPAAPAGTVATDVVLLAFKYGGGTGVTLTPPAGWTLANRTDNGINDGCAVFWGLGSAAFTAWTLAGIRNTITCFTLGYIGVNNVTPMDVVAAGQNNVSSPIEPTPAITPITAGAQLVGFGGYYDRFAGPVPIYSGQSIDAIATTLEQSGGIQGVPVDTTALAGYDAAWTSGPMSGIVATNLPNISQGIIVALRPAASFEGSEYLIPVVPKIWFTLPPFMDEGFVFAPPVFGLAEDLPLNTWRPFSTQRYVLSSDEAFTFVAALPSLSISDDLAPQFAQPMLQRRLPHLWAFAESLTLPLILFGSLSDDLFIQQRQINQILRLFPDDVLIQISQNGNIIIVDFSNQVYWDFRDQALRLEFVDLGGQIYWDLQDQKLKWEI